MDGSASAAPLPPKVESSICSQAQGCIPAVISSGESWQLGWRVHIKTVVAEGAQISLWMGVEHRSVGVGSDRARLGWFCCSSQGIFKHGFYLQHSSPGFQGVKIQFGTCLDAERGWEGRKSAPCSRLQVLSQQSLS